jgi:glycerophosphoryl diester phosphodiesterase
LFPNPGSPEIVGPGIELLTKNPGLIAKFKDKGKKIFVWTVNSTQDLSFCLQHNIDAILTDYPDEALRLRG